jgi:tRNA(fMet)-specific endonuclease VapC
MKYVFDTDILSNLMKPRPSSRLIEKLGKTAREFQFTSAITTGELYYGAWHSGDSRRFLEKIREVILPSVKGILPFDEDAAGEYGRIRAELESAGEVLPEPDLRIAAICIANSAVLVTGNIKHFQRIKRLKVENWI